MPVRGPTFRTLLRTTTLLQPSTTRPLSHLPLRSPSPTHSLSPTSTSLQTRNVSIPSSTTQWTRFSTPYSISSVRTFTSSRVSWRANDEPVGAETSSEAVRDTEEAMERITELYGTARDEFEIAAEETEKNTTYAPDDREAARTELDSLLAYYKEILEGGDRAVAEEVKRRAGQRIRELEQAVIAMEEVAMHGD